MEKNEDFFKKYLENEKFVSAALHCENGFNVWKLKFSSFFPIFTIGIEAKLNELESESGKMGAEGIILVNPCNARFP